MKEFNGANGVNGHFDGHANGNGTATLERSNGASGEALRGISMLDGALLDLNANGASADVSGVDKTARRTRNPYNARLQRELELTEKVCNAALRSDYATALLDWGVTEAQVRALLADVRLARTTATLAQQETNVRRGATAQESVAKRRLMLSFRLMQTAARKAFAQARPDHVYDYGVANPLSSRAAFTQVYDSILKQLETDTLPGITTAKIETMTTRYDAWKASQGEQSDAQSSATTFRAQRNGDTKNTSARRREIQIAANGEWAPSPENHGTRREFGLNPRCNFAPKHTGKKK